MDIRRLQWPLVLGLGALALVRPLLNIVTDQVEGVDVAAPVLATVAVSLVWIAVVGLFRVDQPVLTLVCAGLAYAVLAMLLSGLLSVALDGELQGPLASPIAIVPVLLTNAVWGALAGLLALLLQRLRGGARRKR
ncbi:hypothetical protein [Streptomonospora litoralis]|uniref:Uncharacterized protein n=1 Tax=Streptomonospora litoralis TaxID=2498135 RepID=A0A4P6Q2V5_9ACTN|nr:hypothetical protein [Streptomonospora litoralis]QBI54988.1 hypothetical protein EKD16_16080 [Streptomonospora litoralis]